jgi:hypothetical protein
MSLATRFLKQTAVYWAPGSEDSGGSDFDEFGKPQYATYVQITCRWEQTNEEYIDAKGTQRVTTAVVYTDEDVIPGGVLMLGVLADVTDVSVPKNNANAAEIMAFEKQPTFKATDFLRIAKL